MFTAKTERRSVRDKGTKRIALMGLLFALAMVLSYLESLIPSIGMPGIKLGLSNVVTMYCLFFIGPMPAIILALLKSGFVFLMGKGAVAVLLSAAGGLCSVLVMAGLAKLKASKGATSIAGAVAHNIAQLAVAAWIIGMPVMVFYLPALVISGVVMGLITALILKYVTPAFSRFNT